MDERESKSHIQLKSFNNANKEMQTLVAIAEMATEIYIKESKYLTKKVYGMSN